MSKEKKSSSINCGDAEEFIKLLDEHLSDDIICDLTKFPGENRIDMWAVFILYQLRYVGVCSDCKEKMTEYLKGRLDKYKKDYPDGYKK